MVLPPIDETLNIWPDNLDFIALKALTYHQLGELDQAEAVLNGLLLKLPGYLTPALLRLAPDFDPLRGDSRFEQLCQEKQ